MLPPNLMLLVLSLGCRDDGVKIYSEPPSITIVSPSSGTVFYEEDLVEFRAEIVTVDATDPGDVTHRWVSGTELLCEEDYADSDGAASCAARFDDAGEYTISVTAQSPSGDSAVATVDIIVAFNEPPSVTLTKPLDGAGLESTDLVVFEATVTDNEDSSDLLSVSVKSSQDGDLGISGSPTSSGDYSGTAYLTGGTHLLTITATDTEGKTAQDTATVYVNDAPSAPVVEISPDPAASGEQLTANIATPSVDPEGDAISYRYDWSVDGSLYSSGTSPVVPSDVTLRGEYWEVQVYPSDGTAEGSPGGDGVTIGNSGPTITGVTLSPTSAKTLDDILCTPVGFSDPDGDSPSYSYSWITDGTVDSGETSDTYPSSKTLKGMNLQCEVTPSDGSTDGPPKTSSTLTVQNSPPTAPSLSITPSSPEPEDALTCNIDTASTDDDSDTISYSYSWTQNGTSTSQTSSVVVASATFHADVWQCTVTPNDGEDDGASASASVTVNDVTAPDAPLLDDPEAYRNEDDLGITGSCEADCTLTFYFSDPTGSWSETGTCTSSGAVSHTSYLTRGYETEVYATCEDDAGNVSGNSNTITTEVCDPEDTYENSTGYGDAGADSIDEWDVLSDDGTDTIVIEGNALTTADEDWYVISTTDDYATDVYYGFNDYNFDVSLSSGESTYTFYVYKGGYSSSDLECSTYTDGYSDFSYYQEDIGEGVHSIPADTSECAAAGDSLYNECTDMTEDWYIQVVRVSSASDSCQGYELTITNGL